MQETRENRRAIIRRERAWHEQEASRRRAIDRLLYGPPAFDGVVERGLVFLDPRPGEVVLDLGCGEGKESLQLARRGLRVVGVDLSPTQLARTRRPVASEAPEAKLHVVQASADELPFAGGAFRVIYGKAVLHHVNVEAAAGEIVRLLKAGGRATFAEPLAGHPLFWLLRRVTPQLRSPDERPLRLADLRRFGRRFAESEVEVAFLLAPLAYPIRLLPGGEPSFRRLHGWLQRLDSQLFARVPPLRHLAWYGLVHVRK